MKIQDRINAIDGVVGAHWAGGQNKLTVYYSNAIPKDTIKIRVAGAIGEAHLQEAIEDITLISEEQTRTPIQRPNRACTPRHIDI